MAKSSGAMPTRIDRRTDGGAAASAEKDAAEQAARARRDSAKETIRRQGNNSGGNKAFSEHCQQHFHDLDRVTDPNRRFRNGLTAAEIAASRFDAMAARLAKHAGRTGEPLPAAASLAEAFGWARWLTRTRMTWIELSERPPPEAPPPNPDAGELYLFCDQNRLNLSPKDLVAARPCFH